MDNMKNVWVISSLLLCFTVGGLADTEQCGKHANDTFCPNNLADIISRDTFEKMLKHRDNAVCPARGFYTYDAFIQAAESFPDFAATGDNATNKREAAAFLGQTSHETNGGWLKTPDVPYSWGYCFKEQLNRSDFCDHSIENQYPCAPGKWYYGRGPIQLKGNYNYGQAGKALKVDLLNNPELLATDPVLSFKVALWFWMTSQSPKPSCHDVITGRWIPSAVDVAAGRLPGYGLVSNIIIGGLECGKGPDSTIDQDRIGYFKRYCDMLGVGYGDNLNCSTQGPFGYSSLIDVI